MHRAQQRLARATIDGAPEENLDLLRRYITESVQAIQLSKQIAAPAGGPTGGQPNLAAVQPTAAPAPGMGQVPMGGAPAPMAA
jgi:hypothetical protein